MFRGANKAYDVRAQEAALDPEKVMKNTFHEPPKKAREKEKTETKDSRDDGELVEPKPEKKKERPRRDTKDRDERGNKDRVRHEYLFILAQSKIQDRHDRSSMDRSQIDKSAMSSAYDKSVMSSYMDKTKEEKTKEEKPKGNMPESGPIISSSGIPFWIRLPVDVSSYHDSVYDIFCIV